MTDKKTIDLKTIFANAPPDQKEFLQFHADCVLLNHRLLDLITEYPGQYAGACQGEVLVAPTPEELFAKFGENAKRTAWVFLSSKPINLFLAA